MGKGVSSGVLVYWHVICANFVHICAPTAFFCFTYAEVVCACWRGALLRIPKAAGRGTD